MDIYFNYQIQYSKEDLEELNKLQLQMLNLINTKENWESINSNVDLEQNIFQRIKERQNNKGLKASPKELLGISPSSRVAYCPLLLRQLTSEKNSQGYRKQLIPVQQALLEKYSAQWQEKAGANYPFVRLNNEQKVEFAHLVKGLDKEEMSRYIVIDPKDHRMYSEKSLQKNEERNWKPPTKEEKQQSRAKESIDKVKPSMDKSADIQR